jgi:hypothetical protein
LRGRPDGIFVAPFEQGQIGPELFRKACEFNLEGLVSKHAERAYSGQTPHRWRRWGFARSRQCGILDKRREVAAMVRFQGLERTTSRAGPDFAL